MVKKQPAIQPAEWFDLDREEKPMKNPHDTPPVDDWFPDEDNYRLVCPTCGSDDFIYAGEAYDDDQYLGSSYDCQDCGRSFTMDETFHDY